jgi:hypothetical protein
MSDEVTPEVDETQATTEVEATTEATPETPDTPSDLLNGDETTEEAEAETEEESTEEDTTEEEIEYSFEYPEGFEVDEGDEASFKEVAKELKMPAEQAQRLVQWFAEQTVVSEKQAYEAAANRIKEATKELKEDAEFGGDNFTGTLNGANGVLRNYGGEEAVAVLQAAGVASEPAVVRMLARIAKELKEDKVEAAAPSGVKKDTSLGQRLFGKVD